MERLKILVTGGAGYIGSHTCVQLIENGYDVIIADNLINSREESIRRIEKITGSAIVFYKVDLCDAKALDQIFTEHQIHAVIHFAGLKAVGESVKIPLRYYENNLESTLNLLQSMDKHRVYRLVFSSSATVYGNPQSVPVREDFPTMATNPYGATKLFIERILIDLCNADSRRHYTLLRYFNPIGAHKSGLIGEDPNGIPNNLFPYITQVAIGKLSALPVYGNDYPTPDKTGVRDYIHVLDLASGHLAALHHIDQREGVQIYNLGTGTGYSVLDMVSAFERVNHVKVPYYFADRRPGDIAVCYADAARAEAELGWKAQHGLEEMCEDSWRWQMQNPNGYKGGAL